MWRFHPQTDELVRLVRVGRGRRVRVVRTAFGFGGIAATENVRLQTALEGGALMDVGCYCVSALRLLCGEPERVSGEQVTAATASTSASPARCASPATSSARSTAAWTSHRRHSIEVVGSEGTILVPSPWQTPHGARDPRAARRDRADHPEAVDPYARELDEVGAAIAEGRAPRLGRDDSLGQARVIEALYRSADDGVVVSL